MHSGLFKQEDLADFSNQQLAWDCGDLMLHFYIMDGSDYFQQNMS